MDEYTILKKKRKKNGFASTALLISIAIALIAMVGAVLILNKVDTKKVVTDDENVTASDLFNGNSTSSDADEDDDEDEDTDVEDNQTCAGFNKEVVFNENIKTMKEAAISYFTNERLPQTVGENVTVTLKEMKKAKLVRNIYDASGKTCNGDESYVEVTKDDNEYVLKVFLSCSNMEDYILVHMGCYDYCESDVCEKKSVKEYEYEYKKTISCEMGDWSSWGEWQTKREKTSNLKKEDIKVETISTDTTSVIDAVKNTTYSCSKYPGYKLSGTKCIKETITKDVKDATASKYSYNCDKYPGYSVVGTQCVKETKRKDTIDAYKNPTTYSCPSGYTLNGTKCERTVSKTATTTGSYVCASGYTLSGTSCKKTTTTTDTKNGSYVCASGYTLSGTKCSKTTTTTDTKSATAKYDTRVVTKESACRKQECTTKTVFSCPSGKACGNYPQTSCTWVSSTCYDDVTETYLSGYTCPSGYTLNKTTCTKTTSSTDTKDATFTCPSGYTVSGTSCKKTTSTTDTKNATFTCPSGYTVNGTSCKKTYQEKETVNAVEKPATYYCKTDYTLSGTKCERTVIVRETKESDKVPGGYVCKTGYKLDGTKCIKEIKNKDTKNADSNKTYSCPSGYKLNGTKCSKGGKGTVKKTYYRYATRSCTGGGTEYEWSTSKNDSILKSEGYKLTGKKRELIVK